MPPVNMIERSSFRHCCGVYIVAAVTSILVLPSVHGRRVSADEDFFQQLEMEKGFTPEFMESLPEPLGSIARTILPGLQLFTLDGKVSVTRESHSPTLIAADVDGDSPILKFDWEIRSDQQSMGEAEIELSGDSGELSVGIALAADDKLLDSADGSLTFAGRAAAFYEDWFHMYFQAFGVGLQPHSHLEKSAEKLDIPLTTSSKHACFAMNAIALSGSIALLNPAQEGDPGWHLEDHGNAWGNDEAISNGLLPFQSEELASYCQASSPLRDHTTDKHSLELAKGVTHWQATTQRLHFMSIYGLQHYCRETANEGKHPMEIDFVADAMAAMDNDEAVEEMLASMLPYTPEEFEHLYSEKWTDFEAGDESMGKARWYAVLRPWVELQKKRVHDLCTKEDTSWKLYVYPIKLQDFGIDPRIIAQYEEMFDFKKHPVLRRPLLPCNCDYEHHRVIYSPRVGLPSTADCLGHRSSRKSKADRFFLPISGPMLCAAAAFVKQIERQDGEPTYHASQHICPEYYEVLHWLFDQESWEKNGGKDHIFLMDNMGLPFWGVTESQNEAVGTQMSNVMFLSKEDRGANPESRVGSQALIVPYYTAREEWLAPLVAGDAEKTKLVAFFGSATEGCHLTDCSKWRSKEIRNAILKELEHGGDEVFLHTANSGRSAREKMSFSDMLDAYKKSVFCVVPPGDTYNAKRLYSVLLAGCIPVIVNDNVQLPYTNTFQSWDEFTVTISEKDFFKHGLLELLRPIGDDHDKVAQMQTAMKSARMSLSYSLDSCSASNPEDSAQTLLVKELGAHEYLRE